VGGHVDDNDGELRMLAVSSGARNFFFRCIAVYLIMLLSKLIVIVRLIIENMPKKRCGYEDDRSMYMRPSYIYTCLPWTVDLLNVLWRG
jgi:hypothetical protein